MSIDRYRNIAKLRPEFANLDIDSFIPTPTEQEYTQRYITRYFVQKSNDENAVIREVNVEEFTRLSQNPFYKTVELDWSIYGTTKQVREANRKSILLASRTIQKISIYLPNLLQLARIKDEEIRTKSEERRVEGGGIPWFQSDTSVESTAPETFECTDGEELGLGVTVADDADSFLHTAMVYDPVNDNWYVFTRLTSQHAALVYKDKVLVDTIYLPEIDAETSSTVWSSIYHNGFIYLITEFGDEIFKFSIASGGIVASNTTVTTSVITGISHTESLVYNPATDTIWIGTNGGDTRPAIVVVNASDLTNEHLITFSTGTTSSNRVLAMAYNANAQEVLVYYHHGLAVFNAITRAELDIWLLVDAGYRTMGFTRYRSMVYLPEQDSIYLLAFTNDFPSSLFDESVHLVRLDRATLTPAIAFNFGLYLNHFEITYHPNMEKALVYSKDRPDNTERLRLFNPIGDTIDATVVQTGAASAIQAIWLATNPNRVEFLYHSYTGSVATSYLQFINCV